MEFTSQLRAAWKQQSSLLCVGLDPDPQKFPRGWENQPDKTLEFCKSIVDATAPYACCFKPQIAYFSAHHQEEALREVIEYIHVKHAGLPVILDMKRGDIGATAEQYAREAFERYKADAITVNPYLGRDSIEPYLQYTHKGVIILCRTSNRGGADLQNLMVRGSQGELKPLYQHVAWLANHEWNQTGQMALVVGATYPEELGKVRKIVGNMPILVPGIGAQGGDIEQTVSEGVDDQSQGMMISSSRAILYASSGDDFAQAAATVARATRDAINEVRFRAYV